MSPKRTAQTAAKRAREQAVRERRERKAAKKRGGASEGDRIEGGSPAASEDTPSQPTALEQQLDPVENGDGA